jgi:hypothetical protein
MIIRSREHADPQVGFPRDSSSANGAMNGGLKQTEHAVETPQSGSHSHADWPRGSTREPDQASIERELELILASHFFHASKRSQQFLKFVVRYRLEGNEEPLKERLIGTVLYNRPAGYATGDDSVVRVQAGEVRRRLEQYYQERPASSLVHIDLPLGSYAPEFRWNSVLPPVMEDHSDSEVVIGKQLSLVSGSPKKILWVAGLACTLLLVGTVIGSRIHDRKPTETVINQFWSPVFSTSKPVLICLPKPIFYRPSTALFKRSERVEGEFDKEVDRMNGRPHLRSGDRISWGDMVEYGDFGVSKGDVKAAFRLSNLLAKLGKDTELRIGSDYGWDDLRNASAIVIGAFSNPWSMKIISGLQFSFVEHNSGSAQKSGSQPTKPEDRLSPGEEDAQSLRIEEQGASGRSWSSNYDPRTSILTEDYGLISRLVNSSTGQFVVSVAGITAPGSEAAAEVASSQEELQRALRNAAPDWYRKNVQIVVKTTVVDGVAGPPEIVAVNVW